MRIALRFIIPLVLILSVMAYAAKPLVRSFTEGWFRKDLEMRSALVFNSIQDSMADALDNKNKSAIEALFRRVTKDERLLAMAFCSPKGEIEYRSDRLPANFNCDGDYSVAEPVYKVISASGGPILTGSFILSSADRVKGKIVTFHDMSYISNRRGDIEQFFFVFLIALGLASSLATAFVARFTLKGWVESVIASLETGTKKRGFFLNKDMGPALLEVQKRIRELTVNSRPDDDVKVNWTPNTLKQIIANDLSQSEILIVSNREPYIHNLIDGKIQLQTPASGLVTALEPIVRAAGGTWVAHGSGSADKDTVDDRDRIKVPPQNPAYTLKRIWLNEEEEKGYYYGFANEGFWPLCHIAFTRPVFRNSDWQQYKAVNQKFANALAAECKTKKPLILVQDYHFALLPRMIKQLLPDAIIVLFWHIPWPNSETFGICPWRDEILDGMLGADIVGFHTQFHCNNFIETVDRFLECRIDREHSTITYRGKPSLVQAYPVSIEWPPTALSAVGAVAECREQIRAKYNIPEGCKLGVGVERFDYTKGILDRFNAIDSFFEKYPSEAEKFTFLQIAAPTRGVLQQYKNLHQDSTELVDRINKKYGKNGWKPIILVPEHHEPKDVYTLFRAADLCVVSSLHDGMNLVAKEFVAAREDEQGVLILSAFAGASRELLEALIVNPYDPFGMAEAIHLALNMSPKEQTDRMRLMRDTLKDSNIYRWAGQILLDAARISKRDLLNKQLAVVFPTKSEQL